MTNLIKFIIPVLCFCFLSLGVNAQIEFHELEPEISVCPAIVLDVNNDSIGDISIANCDGPFDEEYHEYNCLHSLVEIHADCLDDGQLIDSTISWGTDYAPVYLGLNDGYIAFRYKEAGNNYYGWFQLRFFVHTMTCWAINTTPNVGLMAGQGPSAAYGILVEDLGDNQDASDIQVTFKESYYPDSVSEYRVVLINTQLIDSISTFDLDTVSSYETYHPQDFSVDGELTEILPNNLLDIEYGQVTNGMSYYVGVINVITSSGELVLSVSEEPVELKSVLPDIGYFNVFDRGFTNTPADLFVEFDTLDDEQFLAQYRIYIIPVTWDTLGVDELLSSSNYFAVLNNQNISETFLNGTLKDYSGNNIIPGVYYKAQILTVPVPGSGWDHSASRASNGFVFQQPDLFYAGDTSGGIFVQNTYIDLSMTYVDLDLDGTNDIYFEMWSYAGGQNDDGGQWMQCHPSSGVSIRVNDSELDLYGEPILSVGDWSDYDIIFDHPYDGTSSYSEWTYFPEAYLMFRIEQSAGTYVYGWMEMHWSGGPSGIVYTDRYALDTVYPAVPSVGLISVIDVDSTNTAEDILVCFLPALNEELISEYQVYFAPQEMNDVTLEQLQDCPHYIQVLQSKSNYEVRPDSTQKDILGNPLLSETLYKTYVVSVADPAYGRDDSFSAASNCVYIAHPNVFITGQTTRVHYFQIDSLNYTYNPLDLNHDGFDDIFFTDDLVSPTPPECTTTVYFDAELYGDALVRVVPTNLEMKNEPILSIGDWSNTVNYYTWWELINDCPYDTWVSEWTDYPEGYLVFKTLYDSTNTSYGWIRFRMYDDTPMAIDYAIDYIPDTTTADTTQELSNFFSGESVIIYPNPASDFIFLKNESGLKDQMRLDIIDAYGQCVHTSAIQSTITRVDIGFLNRGYYYAFIRRDNTLINIKGFVKLK